jgi:uncharacterized protein YbaP (TraB family)
MTNSLLWETVKDNFPKSFIFGTLHVYDSNIFQIPETVFRLIDSVDLYVPEADNRQIPYSDMLSYMTVDDPDYSLQDYFSTESYAMILELSKTDANVINKYKPLFVSSLILKNEDMPEDSIDSELLRYASRAGKHIHGLETFKSQVDAIDSIPYREQSETVEQTLLSQNMKSDFNRLMNNYRRQNLQALNRDFKATNPAAMFVDSILKNRNIAMCNKIVSLSHTGHSMFIAVGAMHLPDVDEIKGIVSILGDRGYSLRAIDFEFTD